MSHESRRQSLAMAKQKMFEARRWWEAWDNSIDRYRTLAVAYVGRVAMLHDLPDVPFHYDRDSVADQLRMLVDQAHDEMLLTAESILSCAAAAVACETMSRVYWEEFEERIDRVEAETGRLEALLGGLHGE